MKFVPDLVKWAKGHGRWIREHDPVDKQFVVGVPRPGDLMIYGDFQFLDSKEQYKHVGLVERVTNHEVVTIDGNVGNRVSENHRSRAFDGVSDYIAGYVRMFPNDVAPAAQPVAVGEGQTNSTCGLSEMVARKLIFTLDDLTANKELVAEIQQRFIDIGLLGEGDSDGIVGDRTLGAMRRFCDSARLDNLMTRRFGPTFAEKLIDARKVSAKPEVPVDLSSPRASNDDKFAIAMRFVLKWEGAVADIEADLGGLTNQGVIQNVYDSYRISKQLPTRSVRMLEDRERDDIYANLYWKACQADLMVTPLAVTHFDSCVNFGVYGGTTFLEEALGLPMDGTLDHITRQAVLADNTKELAQRIVEKRIAYRHQRVRENPSQSIFLAGWLNRDNDLAKLIETL